MPTADLIQKHREWKSREIDWNNIHDREEVEETVPCARCGCFGNGECCHDPLDENRGCILSSNMVCPCCLKVVVTTRKENELEKTGQEDMFAQEEPNA
jgi:hypothetical protein